MKVLHINSCDLPGRIFNGYDLSIGLRKEGIDSKQMVFERTGKDSISFPVCSEYELCVRHELIEQEKQMAMINLLEPFSFRILGSRSFKEADIVHCHLLHNHILALQDFPIITSVKPTIWTVHDPWIVSGGCVYPLNCDKWKTGCMDCEKIDSPPFPMAIDKTGQLWQIKQKTYKKMDVDIIVATKWMEDYIRTSPLTKHFKNVHRIPFGLDIDKFNRNKIESKQKFNIPKNDVVISFRAEDNPVKGLPYIIRALEAIADVTNITILTNGSGKLPDSIKRKFNTIECGWQEEDGVLDLLGASDIFLMPSLAESFGLMAIEAMASMCAVIVFKDTVLEQITYSPECGIAVEFGNYKELAEKIKNLIMHPQERKQRGMRGREIVSNNYKFSDYVDRHIEIYKGVLEKDIKKRDKRIFIDMENNVSYIGAGIQKIRNFQSMIKKMSNNQAQKICIYSIGEEGKRLYQDLRKRLVRVNYFIDNDISRQGLCAIDLQDEVPFIDYGWDNLDSLIEKEFNFKSQIVEIWKCQGMEKLLNEKGNVLIIVPDNASEPLLKQFDEREFPFVVRAEDVRRLMNGVPGIDNLCYEKKEFGLDKIDYSSAEVQNLITCFNRTVAGICQYYEDRLNQYKEEK